MKAMRFEVIIPLPQEPSDSRSHAMLSAFLRVAKESRRAASISEGTLGSVTAVPGFTTHGDALLEAWIVSGQILVDENQPTPDPRDHKWGLMPGCAAVRKMVGDKIPPGSLKVRQISGPFIIPLSESAIAAARERLANPPTDGCDGGPGVEMMREDGVDMPTSSSAN